jgi:hypothetical protein
VSFRTCGVFLAIFLTGCSMVPPLGEATGVYEDPTARSHKNGIFVGDIVKRVKCELSLSFRDKLIVPNTAQKAGKKKGEPLPSWLADWTVKADLTLQANEQGGISPNGSYTAYQKNAVNTVAGPTASPGTTLGTVSQFFTLSLNANAGEQAVRSETLSFTVALKELKDWPLNEAGGCPGEDQRELRGNLGISEWINDFA